MVFTFLTWTIVDIKRYVSNIFIGTINFMKIGDCHFGMFPCKTSEPKRILRIS